MTQTTANARLRTLDMTYIAIFTVLMAVCAWISIPVTTIVFTLQTFAVFAALLTLGGWLGWVLIAVNAALAVVGITLKVIDLNRFNKLSLVLYAAMGWLIFPAIRTVASVLPMAGFLLLLSGGIAYTLGIAFYTSKKHCMHFVFHLFVLLGSILQYFCVLLYCV